MSTKNRSPKPASGSGRTAVQNRLAAQQALAAASRARSDRRRRVMTVIGPIAGVLIIVAVLVVVRVVTGVGGSAPQKVTTASNPVISAVTSVPPSVLDTIGTGTVRTLPTAVNGQPLTQDGKPRVLYVGAEYCPYCAAERWAMVVALSRFGTFTGLGQTASSPTDVYPSTPTLTFHGASYTSKYIAFTGKETQSSLGTPLDSLSAADQAIVSRYDQGGSIPFVSIGGKYIISGASYDPQVLHGMTHRQVAAALSDPSSPVAKAVLGTANVITATICDITGGQPTNVCSSPGVTAAKGKLSGAAS